MTATSREAWARSIQPKYLSNFAHSAAALQSTDNAMAGVIPSATGGLSFRFDFVERLARIPEGIDSRGDAAIDADLQQDLLDLVLGHAVLQSALDVQLQLMGPPQCTEHRQI